MSVGLKANVDGTSGAIQVNGSDVVTVNSSGYLGVGTTSPAVSVDVAAVSGAQVRVKETVSGVDTRINSVGSPGNAGIVGTYSNNPLVVYTNNAERMRIDSAGNVGIGYTTPSDSGADKTMVLATTGPICINKTYTSSTGSTAASRIDLAIGRANAYALLGLYDGSATPYVALDTGSGVTGSVYVRNGTGGVQLVKNATSWTSASDERMKTILEPITGAVDKLNTLRTVVGRYNFDTEDVQRLFVIAQDVQKVFPEAVSVSKGMEGEPEDLLGVAYTDLVPALIAAVKELSARVSELEAR